MNVTSNDIPDNDDLLAAEYVLGLVEPAMRDQLRARAAHDAAFAALVDDWEARFEPWLAAIAPATAPEGVWSRVRDILWQHELGARTPVASIRPSLWERLSFWRGLAAGGFAVAAASLAALLVTVRTVPEPIDNTPAPVVTIPTPAPAAPMTVSLLHDDGSAAYNAVVNPDTGVIVLVPVHMPDDVRVPELWLIGDDGVPKSLGVIARDRAMQVRIPDSVRRSAQANAVFAVSLEPAGGSPSGQPTGPVVAKGSLIAL